jgi:putative transposase
VNRYGIFKKYLSPRTIIELVDLGDSILKNKRRNHSAQFKAKVALATAKGQKTIAELANDYKVHPTQIVQWKKHLMDSLPEIFSVRRKKEQQEQELLTNELYQQIGQLKVELDWLKKKSGYDT